MKRIDAHIHAENLINLEPTEIKERVSDYRKLGIDKVVLIEGEEVINKALEVCPDFIIPIIRIDCDTATPAEVKNYLDQGMSGVKFIGPHHAYSDKKYFPLYEAIDAAGKVAVFHTGYLLDVPRYKHANMIDMKPGHIEFIARNFPDLKILMAHYGNPWWQEAWKVSYVHPNIYADLSGGTAYQFSRLIWQELFAPDGKLFKPAVEKLCFASDIRYFNENNTLEIETYFEFYDDIYQRIGIDDELIQKINYGNAVSLFDL